jgi:hypothetical protein
MRKLLIALMVLPLAASDVARAEPRTTSPGTQGDGRADPQAVMKRLRLARTLGLAEALDLDTAQALKLGEAMDRFDARRAAVWHQAQDARDALRRAAQGEKVAAGDVDGAISKILDARAQSQALDKEMIQALTQGLSPERKARAVLFMGQFRQRMERRVRQAGAGMKEGGMGGGMAHGRGMEMGMAGGAMQGMGARGAGQVRPCDPASGAGGQGSSADDEE